MLISFSVEPAEDGCAFGVHALDLRFTLVVCVCVCAAFFERCALKKHELIGKWRVVNTNANKSSTMRTVLRWGVLPV